MESLNEPFAKRIR